VTRFEKQEVWSAPIKEEQAMNGSCRKWVCFRPAGFDSLQNYASRRHCFMLQLTMKNV
jgi:hypothetical protein